VTIRNCLFGLIALVEAPRGAAAREFIVSNERKSFAGGKKSYWNFSNCCWMRENRVSLDTAERWCCLPTQQRKCRSGKSIFLWRAREPLDCIYHFIQTKESVIEAIILPLCILLLNCLRLYAPNLWLGNKNVTFSHNHTQSDGLFAALKREMSRPFINLVVPIPESALCCQLLIAQSF
jgi:hypothetical protein